jgi:DNA modification methylase
VADPFLGSGTTIDAAVQHGRRGIGCDVRESQVELTRRRMRNCTPTLFSEE